MTFERHSTYLIIEVISFKLKKKQIQYSLLQLVPL